MVQMRNGVNAKMQFRQWKGPQGKARVWATCPETKWLMLVDIDIENGTVCITSIYDQNKSYIELIWVNIKYKKFVKGYTPRSRTKYRTPHGRKTKFRFGLSKYHRNENQD